MDVTFRVYVDGFAPINPSEVIWRRPDTVLISNGGRYTLMNENKALLIESLNVGDSGAYTINFRGAMTTINLNINSRLLCSRSFSIIMGGKGGTYPQNGEFNILSLTLNCDYDHLYNNNNFVGPISIFHGVVQFSSTMGVGVEVNLVVGVEVMKLDQLINHYFDCQSTDGVSNLLWQRAGGSVRFPTSIINNRLRLNMAPSNQAPVNSEDFDVYTCKDTLNQFTMSINITEGMALYLSVY